MQSDTPSDPYINYDKDFIHTPIVTPTVIPVETQKTMQPPKKRSITHFIFIGILGIFIIGLFCIIYVYQGFVLPIQSKTSPITINIPKGSSLQTVTRLLDQAHIIRSPFLFRASMIFGGLESSIKTGEYTFSKPLVMAQVIERLVKGSYEYIPVKLIIREGEDSMAVAEYIRMQFPKISATTTEYELKKREGKLFPETYMFAPFATIEQITRTIDAEYVKRISVYSADIASSSRSEYEILTVASILEKEVPHKDDMRIVAGIIYNRLQKGMPLQMDSTVGYITGKASLELTTDDLKIDSPYNTYTQKGLPPTPIGNPGDASIDAALHPIKHSYIFFLSDKEGVNHYAVTYAQHLENRKKYLGK